MDKKKSVKEINPMEPITETRNHPRFSDFHNALPECVQNLVRPRLECIESLGCKYYFVQTNKRHVKCFAAGLNTKFLDSNAEAKVYLACMLDTLTAQTAALREAGFRLLKKWDKLVYLERQAMSQEAAAAAAGQAPAERAVLALPGARAEADGEPIEAGPANAGTGAGPEAGELSGSRPASRVSRVSLSCSLPCTGGQRGVLIGLCCPLLPVLPDLRCSTRHPRAYWVATCKLRRSRL